jgi:hypothetical protein
MNFTSMAAKTVFYVLVIFGTAGWLAAFYATGQIETIIGSYQSALGRQGSAAYVLANANRLLTAQRDDIAQILIDNTKATDEADLAQLDVDQTSFNQSLSSAAALDPPHTADVLALQAQVAQIIGQDCVHSISLGTASTTDADIIASQREYLSQCAPKFLPLIANINALQNRLRNERNAKIAALEAASKASTRMTYDIVIGWLVLTLLVSLATAHTWRLPPSLRMTKDKPSLAP